MKILLTALELESYSGLPLYTKDLALELKRQGHLPEIYTLTKGPVADELMAANIRVTDNPAQIKIDPDVIHGQHRVSTLIAIKQFRTVPALFICHNHQFWGDKAPFHSRLLLYLGVSLLCMESLRQDGVPEDRIRFSANFVDTNRFKPRPSLPDAPKQALVFSNYANEQTHLPAVREACRQAGLSLDVVGAQAKYVSAPENTLGEYDIIFAKAKAAIESMATGAAVILCDFGGVGPMVTSHEFEKLRLMNFGFQALTKPLLAQNILDQIARYDSKDATRVRDLIRTTATLEMAAESMVGNYEAVIREFGRSRSNRTANGSELAFRESIYWERARFWSTLTPMQKRILSPISRIDPAANEQLYKSARELMKPMKVLLVSIWMTIPEPLRIRIKNLSFVRKLIDLLG